MIHNNGQKQAAKQRDMIFPDLQEALDMETVIFDLN